MLSVSVGPQLLAVNQDERKKEAGKATREENGLCAIWGFSSTVPLNFCSMFVTRCLRECSRLFSVQIAGSTIAACVSRPEINKETITV